MKAMLLDFGGATSSGHGSRRGLRLVPVENSQAGPSGLRGPEKYRLLDLKRRRALIRARRVLGLT